jgi:hypothetical protein
MFLSRAWEQSLPQALRKRPAVGEAVPKLLARTPRPSRRGLSTAFRSGEEWFNSVCKPRHQAKPSAPVWHRCGADLHRPLSGVAAPGEPPWHPSRSPRQQVTLRADQGETALSSRTSSLALRSCSSSQASVCGSSSDTLPSRDEQCSDKRLPFEKGRAATPRRAAPSERTNVGIRYAAWRLIPPDVERAAIGRAKAASARNMNSPRSAATRM